MSDPIHDIQFTIIFIEMIKNFFGQQTLGRGYTYPRADSDIESHLK